MKSGDILKSTADPGLIVKFIKWTNADKTAFIGEQLDPPYANSDRWNPLVFEHIKTAPMRQHLTTAQLEQMIITMINNNARNVQIIDGEITYET